jgi:VanZ family protein
MKKNNRWLALLFPLFTLLWMVVIFSFSADDATQSSGKSLGVGQVVADIFVPDFDEWDSAEQKAWVEKIEHPIRKMGHFTEYAILGFLCMGTVVNWFRCKRYKKLLAWGFATLYAASDEFHQLFVSGRSGQVSDVMLDSAGVLAGIGVFLALTLLFRKIWTNGIRKHRG